MQPLPAKINIWRPGVSIIKADKFQVLSQLARTSLLIVKALVLADARTFLKCAKLTISATAAMKIPTTIFLFLASTLAVPLNLTDKPIDITFHNDPTGRTYPIHVTRHDVIENPGLIPSPAPVTSVQIAPSAPTIHCDIYNGSIKMFTLTESLTYHVINPPLDLGQIRYSCGFWAFERTVHPVS